MSLRTRLLLMSIFVVLIPAMIIGIVATYISSQGLRSEAFGQLESVATLKENQVRSWLDTLQKSLTTVVVDQESARQAIVVMEGGEDIVIEKARLKFDLNRYNGISGYFTEIFIMDPEGVVVLSTLSAQEGKIFTNQDFFNEGIKGPYVNPPVYEPALSNYSIVVSQPLTGERGQTIGVLAGRVNLSTLNDIMNEREGLGESGETYLVNANFAVLTDLRFQEIVLGQTYVRTEGITNAITRQENGSATYTNYHDVPVLGVYRWIPELRIAIIAEHNVAEALQAARALSWVSLLVTLFTVVVFAGLSAFFFTRRISNPIARLANAADSISHGNLDLEVDIKSGDEIGVLADSFNLMTGRLRELIANLEQRVAQRTRALATSGEISRQLSSILDRNTLAIEVVEQLRSAFNYYHAHIYLMDESGTNLVMTGGTGEVGKTLLARGHSIPHGKGLVGRAAESKEAILVANTSLNPTWIPNPLLPETKAEIAVPIIAGNKVLGVLDVQNNIVDSLEQQDVTMLRSIADQVAIALQNITATETAIKRADELQKVAKVSATASAVMEDEQEMLALMVHDTQRAFGLYHAHVFTFDENTNLLAIRACGWKEGDEHEGTHGTTTIALSQEQSLVARAARSRQPVIVNNVREDAGWLPNPLLPDTQSELAVPLVVGDTLVGVLDVQSDRLNAFKEEDANIQTILASQIAIAIQNMRTYQQTRKRAEREALISSINQKIQQTNTVEDALKIAIREVGRALGTQTSIQLTQTLPQVDGKSN